MYTRTLTCRIDLRVVGQVRVIFRRRKRLEVTERNIFRSSYVSFLSLKFSPVFYERKFSKRFSQPSGSERRVECLFLDWSVTGSVIGLLTMVERPDQKKLETVLTNSESPHFTEWVLMCRPFSLLHPTLVSEGPPESHPEEVVLLSILIPRGGYTYWGTT